MNKQERSKLTWKSWFSLMLLVVAFSGIFTHSDSPLRAVDFQVLIGNFGHIGQGDTFIGKGGTGASGGFLFALTLFPTVMFSLGLINVAEHLGALLAAEKVFKYILKPLMGIPGTTGLAFVSSFTSTDAAAVMTKNLSDNNLITDDERAIFASYQIAGSGLISNVFGSGAALIPICICPIGIVIASIFIVKVIGANVVRGYILIKKKHQFAKKGAT
ncbi:nucleoside recognition domain-containing protein [Megasphaera vaginalis (ex Srinivasan et al. 2021)]|uniref:Transporter gate domain protein n=1 Tax=Megasphaera vaginalis (ex Srinivasan et al. 2021) TaxID=1111454 RepID=U7UMY3_9FIRM|nr:nucleoside recognition domain-containing protein [Megasphaera vaginalis (ex Srinivasan et al. 2021)]ERT60807.1 transporter gate domain protein [Megasphaera vaginalis (ex Srinivasan et al. 2021)]